METKTFTARLDLKDGSEEGSVRAAFSVFGNKDSTGDIVRPSFFTDGQEIPMAAWGHAWESLPPGKGVIRVRDTYAEFDGKFFLDTTHGLDHYRTVKHMGGLQEWSFGFQVLDAEFGEQDGEPVRFLTRGETFEASPVLVGANRDTRTLAIKAGLLDFKKRRLSRHQLEAVIATLQALMGDDDEEAVAEALAADPIEDGKAAEQPGDREREFTPDPAAPLTLDLAGAKLLNDLGAYVARLKATPADETVAARAQIAGLLRQLSSARLDLDVVMTRADVLGQTAPRELSDQFRRLAGLYGPISSRQAG